MTNKEARLDAMVDPKQFAHAVIHHPGADAVRVRVYGESLNNNMTTALKELPDGTAVTWETELMRDALMRLGIFSETRVLVKGNHAGT